MNLVDALKGMEVARTKLASPEAVNNPSFISEHMYRLGLYTAEVERFLGQAEEEYEKKWATRYTYHMSSKINGVPVGKGEVIEVDDNNNIPPIEQGMSATAAKQQADVDTAEDKGNIKHLTRLVGSSWKLHTGAMARINHLAAESRGMKHEV